MVDIVIQMGPKCGEDPPSGRSTAVSVTEENNKPYSLCTFSVPKSTKESSPSTVSEPRVPVSVYQRKNRQGEPKNIGLDKTPVDLRSGDSYSIIHSDIPSIVEREDSEAPIVPSSELDTKLMIVCASSQEHRTDEKAIQAHKIIDVESINDWGSSKSNAEHVLVPLKSRNENLVECASATVIASEAQEDKQLSDSTLIAIEARENTLLTGTDMCILMLQKEVLLERAKYSDTCASDEDGDDSSMIDSYQDGSRECKICARSETAEKMLVCDLCDEAYHLSCCKLKRRNIRYLFEWFCTSCISEKHMLVKQTGNFMKLTKAGSEVGTSGAAPATEKPSLISLMLSDDVPYRSNVRVGKGYQANVPEWTGPVKGNDKYGDVGTLEISEHFIPHVPVPINTSKSLICNWLQCKLVIDKQTKTICGKWRRAPLTEVQTDEWECFCSILWDPSHADCAVPQEVDTEEVMKQLKCVKKLKPRAASKRPKAVHPKLDGSKKRKGTTKNT